MQEINLESNTIQQPTVAQITTNSQAPSLAELPSYTEAVRLKKLEADSNDLPPAYFAPGANGPSSSDQARFAIDPTDVVEIRVY